MTVETTYSPNSQPLEPRNLVRIIGAATISSLQSIRFWGICAAWKIWKSTAQLILRTRFRSLRNGSVRVRDGFCKEKAPITMLAITIYPDLIWLWYHFVSKLRDKARTQIIIVDCCGLVDARMYPEARVVKFCNFSHSRKIDFFLRYEIDSPHVWLCDDDSMVVSREALDIAYRQLTTRENTAVVSLQPRGWSFEILGEKHKAMGVYNILFSRDIFIKENLSFSPVRSNNIQIGRGSGYYDTGDYANEQLLLRGYDVKTIETEDVYVKGFVGTCSGMLRVMGLRHVLHDLEKEMQLDPQIASYHLVGLYCDWKVSQLYREIFSEEPNWLPPLSEDELRQLISHLPEEMKESTLKLFERYECNYQHLSRLAGEL